MITIILWVICFNVASFYIFLVWKFNYWKKRGVSGPKPRPFVGNFPSVFTQKRNMACDIRDIYETYKQTEDFVGVFNCRSPQLLITNAELIRQILITDFRSFHDNDFSTMVDEKSDFILANNPFILSGENWKERRAEVTPGLTVSRVKTVFPVTNKVCKALVDYIKQQTKIGATEGLDGKDLSLRFTSEVVTDCVLGLNANCFTNKPTPILDMTKKLFQQSYILIIYMTLVGLLPSLKKFKKLRFTPKPIEKFFVDLMQDSLSLRKSQKEKGVNVDRTDFMNYMLFLQEKKKLKIPELTAHTMTFLLDGFETTAGVLSHCLLLLGRDLSRQKILRQEILEKLSGSNDFDAIAELPYLDACIHETLRLFPPGAWALKLCTQTIDLKNRNGKILKVEQGTTVILPYHAVMMDEDNYTNPDNFEPERFLEENGGLKKYKDKGVYLAWGDGPRVCLGMRFALTQIKAALVEIFRNYEVHVNSKTRTDNKYDPTYFLLRIDGGIWLDFKEVK